MRSAASMLKVPAAWIAAAKDAGVPAFSANGTVDLEPVRRWVKEHQRELEADAGNLSLREQKLVEEVRRLRLMNDTEERMVVPVSEVHSQDAAACSRWNTLRVRVEQEWPVRLAGKDIPECRTVLREMTSAIGAILEGIRG